MDDPFTLVSRGGVKTIMLGRRPQHIKQSSDTKWLLISVEPGWRIRIVVVDALQCSVVVNKPKFGW